MEGYKDEYASQYTWESDQTHTHRAYSFQNIHDRGTASASCKSVLSEAVQALNATRISGERGPCGVGSQVGLPARAFLYTRHVPPPRPILKFCSVVSLDSTHLVFGLTNTFWAFLSVKLFMVVSDRQIFAYHLM